MINHDKLLSHREKSIFFIKLLLKILVNIITDFITVIIKNNLNYILFNIYTN